MYRFRQAGTKPGVNRKAATWNNRTKFVFNHSVTTKNIVTFANHSVPTVDSVRDLFCSAGDFLQPSSRRLLGLEQIRAGLRIDIDRASHGGHGATVGFLAVDAGLRLVFAKIKKIVEVQTRQANVGPQTLP